MRAYLIGAAMIASTVLIVLAGSARAETSRGTGIVCKSQKGVEAIFDYGDKNPTSSIPEAIESVKDDCAIKSIMFEKGDVTLTLTHGEQKYDVTKITVVAVCDNGVCLFGKEEAFSVFQHVEKTSELPREIGLYEEADTKGLLHFNSAAWENRVIARRAITRNGW